MNHLIKKLQLSGGGKQKKPKPEPAILEPPKLGVHQVASSFSQMEMLELISDGPIAGLVNKNNSIVNNLSNLQGIYLDNTAVAVTDDVNVTTKSSAIFAQDVTPNTSSFINEIKNLGDILANQSYGTTYARQPYSYPEYGYNNYAEITRQRPAKSSSNQATNNITLYNYNVVNNAYYKNANHGIYWAVDVAPIQPVGGRFYGYTFGVGRINNKLINVVDSFNDFTNLTYSTDSNLTPQQQYINNIYIQNNLDINISIRNNVYNDLTNRMGSSGSWVGGKTASLYARSETINYVIIDVSEFDFSDSPTDLFKNEDGSINLNLGLIFETLGTGGNVILDYSYPVLDAEGNWNGKFGGLVMIEIKGMRKTYLYYYRRNSGRVASVFRTLASDAISMSKASTYLLSNLQAPTIGNKYDNLDSSSSDAKYNYTNILVEFKNGDEFQTPFQYFNNIHIDKDIGAQLLGPFKTTGNIQRIKDNTNVLTNNYNLNDPDNYTRGLPLAEGSVDSRGTRTYSDWDKDDLTFNEEAIGRTHIIENPNVESIYVTIEIANLYDTVHEEVTSNSEKVKAGSKYPGVLNVEIEVGKIDEDGISVASYTKQIQIIALIESPTLIDFGNPGSSKFATSSYKFIKNPDPDNDLFEAFDPLTLPSAFNSENSEETPIKRYVKVSKLSTETNSILVKKGVSLVKVTEIIKGNCSYPFSAIVGLKFDARTFDSIPSRTYDARLKLVKIPNNYNPTKLNTLQTDKRYYNSINDYNNTSDEDKLIYANDWNGQFKMGWTDNPAWILYDLLTSTRYGLGQYISEDDINKWDLYKIGRFCDAVDDNGYFVGVPDGRGGLEPRFSCNILFQEGTKVFDAINKIANLFRGSVFYNNNEINFMDDRLRDPVAIFSNVNVKDGIFSYTNYRRDQQFNAVEVVYIDRFDDFKTKLEYIEDEEDIVQRGVFKKQINGYGITSRAMANRVGRHMIYQTIKENQTVSFVTGLEALLCKPGDLIIVDDELKSLKSNFGKVLAIDGAKKTIRINEPYIDSDYTSGITIYSPTGQQSNQNIEDLIDLNRTRLAKFDITGAGTSSDLSYWVGNYNFSGYAPGFENLTEDDNNIVQFPVYTGNKDPLNILYYSTLATGWVFATGQAFTDDNTYDKYIGEIGIVEIASLNDGEYDTYLSANPDYRLGSAASFNNAFDNSSGQLNQVIFGVLDSEISLTSIPQITNLPITGYENQDYGSLLYVDQNDINANLVQFIPEGSAYRIQRKNADDQIYKIISIKEENPNEYIVAGMKYDSGKYDFIENNISTEFQSDTFGYGVNHQVNDVNYITLDKPNITQLSTGILNDEFYISGKWDSVLNATGYNAALRSPIGGENSQFVTASEIAFTGLSNVGNYILAVNSLGDSSNSLTNRYFDSNYTITGVSYFDITPAQAITTTAYIPNFNISQ